MNLKNRVEKLEGQHGMIEDSPIVTVRFVSPERGLLPADRLRNHGGQEEFTREAGETEDAFIDRAMTAARNPRQAVVLVASEV
jgi:hypothetical protein